MAELRTDTGAEVFKLFIVTDSFTGTRNIKTDVVNELQIAGYDPEFRRKERTVEAVIPDSVEATDYPNPENRNYPSDMHGYATEIERLLNRENWNLELTENPSVLVLDRGGYNLEVRGHVSGIDTEFNAEQNQYRLTINFVELDIDLA